MIRVAIVGTGGIARSHMEAYRTLKARCEVVALADIIPGRARRFMEAFGLACDTYEHHEDMKEGDCACFASVRSGVAAYSP